MLVAMQNLLFFIDVEGDEWEESIDRDTTLIKECSPRRKKL